MRFPAPSPHSHRSAMPPPAARAPVCPAAASLLRSSRRRSERAQPPARNPVGVSLEVPLGMIVDIHQNTLCIADVERAATRRRAVTNRLNRCHGGAIVLEDLPDPARLV